MSDDELSEKVKTVDVYALAQFVPAVKLNQAVDDLFQSHTVHWVADLLFTHGMGFVLHLGRKNGRLLGIAIETIPRTFVHPQAQK